MPDTHSRHAEFRVSVYGTQLKARGAICLHQRGVSAVRPSWWSWVMEARSYADSGVLRGVIRTLTRALPPHRARFLRVPRQSRPVGRLGYRRRPKVNAAAEAAAASGISAAHVSRAGVAGVVDLSLDRPTGEEEETTGLSMVRWQGKQQDEELEDTDVAATMRACLAVLNGRERAIVKWHYGFDGHQPMTLGDIGRTWGLTRERIRQLRNRALKKLRASCRDQLVGLTGD